MSATKKEKLKGHAPGAFAGKAADERDVIQWIFDNLGVSNVKPRHAPNSGAWVYLQDCKSNDDVRQDFLKNVWTKLLPSRTQMEGAARFKDDGSTIIELLEKLRKAKAAEAIPEPTVMTPVVPVVVNISPGIDNVIPAVMPETPIPLTSVVPVVINSDLGADDEF